MPSFMAQPTASGKHPVVIVVQEAFADRAYRADGRLVSRSEPGALLTTEQEVRRQIRQLLMGSVTSIEGTPVPIEAESVCLHSDTPEAVRFARAVRDELESAGVRLGPKPGRSAQGTA